MSLRRPRNPAMIRLWPTRLQRGPARPSPVSAPAPAVPVEVLTNVAAIAFTLGISPWRHCAVKGGPCAWVECWDTPAHRACTYAPAS